MVNANEVHEAFLSNYKVDNLLSFRHLARETKILNIWDICFMVTIKLKIQLKFN